MKPPDPHSEERTAQDAAAQDDMTHDSGAHDNTSLAPPAPAGSGLNLTEMAGLEGPGANPSRDSCANCHIPLQGPFCHHCGQPTRHFIRFFPVVVNEIMVDSLGIDGRFWRTLLALLFRPGRLTRDYLYGRRVHYSPPIRLYLLSSVVAFLIITNLIDSAIDANLVEFNNGKKGIGLVIEDDTTAEEKAAEAQRIREEVLADLRAQGITPPPGLVAQVSAGKQPVVPVPPPPAKPSDTSADEASAASVDDNSRSAEQPPALRPPAIDFDDEDEDDSDDGDLDVVLFGNEPWDAETNPLILPFLTAGMNQRLNQEIGEFKERLPEIKKNPRILVDRILEILPQAMFLMLPAFALIMKLFYAFSRRYYMEHLLFALHNHAFVFAMISLMAVSSWVSEWLGMENASNTLKSGFDGIAQAWMFIYLFLAQKRVYAQGWIMTSIKFFLVGISYSTLLMIGVVIASLVGVILV